VGGRSTRRLRRAHLEAATSTGRRSASGLPSGWHSRSDSPSACRPCALVHSPTSHDRGGARAPPLLSKGAPMPSSELFALGGIAFVALARAATIALSGSTPGTDAWAERVASFYSDDDVRQFVTSFVLAASTPFLVLFGIGLVDAQGRVESGAVSTW